MTETLAGRLRLRPSLAYLTKPWYILGHVLLSLHCHEMFGNLASVAFGRSEPQHVCM